MIVGLVITGLSAGCESSGVASSVTIRPHYPPYPQLVRIVGSPTSNVASPGTSVYVQSLPVTSPSLPPAVSQAPSLAATPFYPSGVTFPSREVYISGVSGEAKWAVIREMRILGYVVTERSSKTTLRLKARMHRIGTKIVCTTILCERDGLVVAQGKGESGYYWFQISGRYGRLRTERSRYNAEAEAAAQAIRTLAADHT